MWNFSLINSVVIEDEDGSPIIEEEESNSSHESDSSVDVSEVNSKKGSCRLIFLVPQEGQKNALDLNGSFNFER